MSALEEIDAIKQVKYRYCFAVDVGDLNTIADLITQDFVFVPFNKENPKEETREARDAFLAGLKERFASELIGQHQVHHPQITLTGPDSAEGRWYLQNLRILPSVRTLAWGNSTYTDRYRKVAGVWKMSYMRFERLFAVEEPLPEGTQVRAFFR
jgi:hypothetical protein